MCWKAAGRLLEGCPVLMITVKAGRAEFGESYGVHMLHMACLELQATFAARTGGIKPHTLCISPCKHGHAPRVWTPPGLNVVDGCQSYQPPQ